MKDEEFWAYLDEVHAWALTRFERLWGNVRYRSLDETWAWALPRVLSVHRESVRAALFASDDYLLFKAAEVGVWLEPDWRVFEGWSQRPFRVRNAGSAEALFRQVPTAMKWMVGQGMGQQKTMSVGHARAARAVGTDSHAAARNYLREFVTADGGPPLRSDLPAPSRTEFLERNNVPQARRPVRLEGVGGQVKEYRPPPEPVEQLTSRTPRADVEAPSRKGELPRVGPEEGVFHQWRRVPRPGACDFCIMLATRGAVYRSRSAALYAVDGRRYHDFCRCRAQLVTDSSLAAETVLNPEDAGRVVSFKAKGTSFKYSYDPTEFQYRAPEPSWL